MPLPMVHLGIAKSIHNAGFEVKDLSQYYLGVISPDAIHMRKNSDRADKSKTHLIPLGKTWFDIDEAEYIKFLFSYFKSNQMNTDTDFLLGYCIHIYTDMLWVKQIYKNYIDNYRKDTSPIQDERWAYYNDTDRLDQVLFDECSWRNDVWQELQTAKGSDFLDMLSADEINSWNERTLHWFDSGESQFKNPIKYITKKDILHFISECSESFLSNTDF